MYAKELISREVKNSNSFGKIQNQFSALLSLYTDDMAKLEDTCRRFVYCLACAGGPAKAEAAALSGDWEREVMSKHNLKWSLKIEIDETSTKLPRSKIPLVNEIPQKMQNLHEKFVSLLTNIITYYNECKKYNVENFALYLTLDNEDRLTPESLDNCKTFHSLFHSIKDHYNFFNFDIIESLAKKFPLEKELNFELDQYVKELVDFKVSTELQKLKEAIKQVPLPPQASETHCKITIKLTEAWRDRTIDRLEKFLKYLFKRDAKRAKLIEVEDGSIAVIFVVPLSLAQSFIDKAQTKCHFIHLLGAFQLIINSETIIDGSEDVNFSFEDSLLHVIMHIDDHPEYKSLTFCLIELTMQLNYQNTEGQTALFLAGNGGHIEVFVSLLQYGANPFIQLPKNKGYVGLNSLACTTLCQYIYKSIGGEKIIPQDGTSVRDMLKVAVTERRVNASLYDPFVSFVEQKLREKYQSLNNCFQDLDSQFIEATTKLLVSKASVTDIRNILHSYIKDDTICEDVHQLLKLLRPHYSCLNINLLSVSSTIIEPIKKQVNDYITKLTIFKDTTSLLELAMITKESQYPVSDDCSILTLKLCKPWGSRLIADSNKMLSIFILPDSFFLNLVETQQNASSLTCTYVIPSSQTETVIGTIMEHSASLYKIGVFEVFFNNVPIIIEDEKVLFTFEEALLKAYQDTDLVIFSFLTDMNINLSTPLKTDGNNSNSSTAFLNACERGDFLTAEFIFKKYPHIEVNIQNNVIGSTALMLACFGGQTQVVQLILSKDPDIDIQNNDGWTALMFACLNGHHQIVKLLLNKNPDINITDNGEQTALMFACRHGHHQVVELLLSKDPVINIQNINGESALMIASRYGHHQVVELLLSQEPHMNLQSTKGVTALMYACVSGYHQVVQLLLRKNLCIDIQDIHGVTALMGACINGHHQVVELLLSKNPDINIRNNFGLTALMIPCLSGHHQIVELLLSKDLDINIRNNNEETALILACGKGHHLVVEILLRKKPEVNVQNNNGVTALIAACINGHHQVVKFLLSKDPGINIQDNDGVTALMLACAIGHHQIVKLLLGKNPDINIQNKNEETALMLACVNGHHQVVELLMNKDPDFNIQNNGGFTALMAACLNGHDRVVQLLLSKKPDLNIRSNNGSTALMAACLNGHHMVVEVLLRNNPNINIPDHNGFSILILILAFSSDEFFEEFGSHFADKLHLQLKQLQLNHFKILELLLDSHPDHMHTFSGVKLHSIALAAGFNNFKAVEILIKKCDISLEDIIMAFTVACYYGHTSMMTLLSEKLTTLSNNKKDILVAAAVGDIGTLVGMLFEVGMSPDTPLVAGITPLMIAAACGHSEIVDTLIQAGADVNKINDDGYTALNIAKNIQLYDRDNIIQLLAANTSTPSAELDSAVTNTDTISLKSFLEKFKSFIKKSYNPASVKQRKQKTFSGMPISATKSNIAMFSF